MLNIASMVVDNVHKTEKLTNPIRVSVKRLNELLFMKFGIGCWLAHVVNSEHGLDHRQQRHLERDVGLHNIYDSLIGFLLSVTIQNRPIISIKVVH